MVAKRSTKGSRIEELVALFRLSGNQDNAFDNLAAERLGVNRTDLHCLNIIESRSGLTAGELAAEAGLTTGAITGVVDRLERAGYARRVRDPTDRRKISVEVTPQFYARADAIWGPLKRDWEHVLTTRLTAAQLDSVIDFLRATNDIGGRHLERVRREGEDGG
jgi:DNA-binding MarR family transcriptional regulator